MRSPVQIWVAAPLKPVVPQGIAGFYFLPKKETTWQETHTNRFLGINSYDNSDAGKRVTQFMGVKTGYIILLGEFLHVPGWRLRVHRLWAVLLSEDIGADGVSCLLQSELLEQTDDLRVNVNRPHLAALRCVQVNALLWCITEVSSNRDRSGLGVYILPLQSTAFAPTDAGVD